VKTFQQFQQDLQEFAPALAPLAPYVLPAAAAALGAAGMYFAKKQGQGGRSQPVDVDYGQRGETAKPRKPAVQRGRLNPNEAYNKQKQAERAAEARARAQERAEQGIERLIGSDAERAEAARARANQPQIQQQLRRQATARRMSQAADKLGLPEQMTAPKIMLPIDTRTTKEKQKEIKIEADLLPYNPAIGDRYKTK